MLTVNKVVLVDVRDGDHIRVHLQALVQVVQARVPRVREAIAVLSEECPAIVTGEGRSRSRCGSGRRGRSRRANTESDLETAQDPNAAAGQGPRLTSLVAVFFVGAKPDDLRRLRD